MKKILIVTLIAAALTIEFGILLTAINNGKFGCRLLQAMPNGQPNQALGVYICPNGIELKNLNLNDQTQGE